MGLMSNIKKWVDMPEDEFEEDFDIEQENEAEKQDKPVKNRLVSKNSDRQLDVSTSRKSSSSGNQVVIVKPEQFLDASGIADHLLNKRTVVLNLEDISKEESRRMIDFLSGVAYAQEGTLKKVAQATFVVTPLNVDLVGELRDELEENGIFF